MVRSRFLDSTVWGAVVTHWTFGRVNWNAKRLSFVALDRLSGVAVDKSECSGKVSIGYKD